MVTLPLTIQGLVYELSKLFTLVPARESISYTAHRLSDEPNSSEHDSIRHQKKLRADAIRYTWLLRGKDC